jgi:hypothetical protein
VPHRFGGGTRTLHRLRQRRKPPNHGIGDHQGGLQRCFGAGARLVFVVSDGHFVAPGEKKRAAAIVDRFVRNGVVVLWLDLHRRGLPSGTSVPSGAVPIPVVEVADIPQQVEAILVRALPAR